MAEQIISSAAIDAGLQGGEDPAVVDPNAQPANALQKEIVELLRVADPDNTTVVPPVPKSSPVVTDVVLSEPSGYGYQSTVDTAQLAALVATGALDPTGPLDNVLTMDYAPGFSIPVFEALQVRYDFNDSHTITPPLPPGPDYFIVSTSDDNLLVGNHKFTSVTIAHVDAPSVHYSAFVDDQTGLLYQPAMTGPQELTTFDGVNTFWPGLPTAPVTLDGGAGNDILFGGSGDDTLIVSAGGNDLYGGDGADVFQFDAIGQPAIIHDFDVGVVHDILNLTGVLEYLYVFDPADEFHGPFIYSNPSAGLFDLNKNIADFIRLDQNGADVDVMVNASGDWSGNYVHLATIINGTGGLDLNTLLTNNYLHLTNDIIVLP